MLECFFTDEEETGINRDVVLQKDAENIINKDIFRRMETKTDLKSKPQPKFIGYIMRKETLEKLLLTGHAKV